MYDLIKLHGEEMAKFLGYLTVIATFCFAAYNKAWKPCREWIRTLAALIEDFKAHLPMFVQFRDYLPLLLELKNNGGGSIKDQIQQVSRDVKTIKVTQEANVQLDSNARFECSPDGAWVFVNDALCKMFGAGRDELLGTGWLNFIKNPAERKDVIEAWENALESNLEMSYDYNVRNGVTHRDVLLHYKVFIKRDGPQKQIVKILGGVTESEKKINT